MEDKKLNALPDEALDQVAGGATCQKNEATGLYDVYDKHGKVVQSFARKKDAEKATAELSIQERYKTGRL